MREYQMIGTEHLKEKIAAAEIDLAKFLKEGPKEALEQKWQEQSPSEWLKENVKQKKTRA